MRFLFILFEFLLAVVFLVPWCSQATADATGKQEKTVRRERADKLRGPVKEERCWLDSTGIHPYLVTVIDQKATADSIRTGFIFSHLGVISTASPVTKKETGNQVDYVFIDAEDALVVAQRIYYIITKLYLTCSQERKVEKVIIHPKWQWSDFDFTYDYAIFVLREQFDASTDLVYPTAPIPNTLYEYFQLIRRVLASNEEYNGCEIPKLHHFIDATTKKHRNTLVQEKFKVKIKNVDETCFDSYCKKFEPPINECNEWKFTKKPWYMICAESGFDSEAEKTLHGGVMVCNNSLVGMVATFGVTQPEKIAIVKPLLMIWPWIHTYKEILWNRTFNKKDWDSPFIENHRLYYEHIHRPYYNKNVTLIARKVKYFRYHGKWGGKSSGNRLEHSFEFHSKLLFTIIFCKFVIY
ncbi:hypothetical protein GE061_012110 [Apolygus lucorum]|uniref:Peptidase S1 domain-containing protein n=1 Tax=Apolygus lucorum TaxID=248454 RepID=A0A8S9XRN9_APOLU|nr:hypothetical protein GE061_012110 [Apolygus lucorum]